ncbi:hypothetical protein BY458DRAFT_512662 [Sporodiniella umbellata]|nr:hypothetical protein BY458DRAFT_512662 [Sporodiniella umbellata]
MKSNMPPMSISSITTDTSCYYSKEPYCTSDSYHDQFLSTTNEKRERNKAASAKYRIKKNMEYREMRNTIQKITTKNQVLETQLQKLREENRELRLISDQIKDYLSVNALSERRRLQRPLNGLDGFYSLELQTKKKIF